MEMTNSQDSVAEPTVTKPKTAFFQFRLREILLAMVAICATVTVFVKNWRSNTATPIYGAARVTHLIPQIAAKHGVSAISRGGGTSESRVNVYDIFTTSQEYVIPEGVRGQIQRDVWTVILEKIAESGGRVNGHATGGESFMVEYDCGYRSGVIYVAFYSNTAELWRIDSLIVESSR